MDEKLEIPNRDVAYGGEKFFEYYTVGLSGTLYQGMMHAKEVMPHVPLVGIVSIGRE